MDEKFHRVIVDGEPYYRKIEFGDLTGELMCEEDFMDYVMSIVVPTETYLDEDDVEYAVCRMDDDEDKQLVSNYIAYLKMAAGM